MQLISLLVCLCAAASFTPFPYFKGNREKLNKLLAAAGNLVDNVPQEATSFDDIFSHELLLAMAKACSDLKEFGSLLEDLSPGRFDHLCDELHSPHRRLKSLVTAYPKAEGRWKRYLAAWPSWPLHEGFRLKGFSRVPTVDYMNRMLEQPFDIAHPRALEHCINRWVKDEENHEMIRKLCEESQFIGVIDEEWLPAYVGHEGEYAAMVTKHFKSYRARWWLTIPIPPAITLEQLKPLAEWVEASSVCDFGNLAMNVVDPAVKAKLVELNELIARKRIKASMTGFDTNPFQGQWPSNMLLQSCRPDEYDSMGKPNMPIRLNYAIEKMVYFGDEEVLKNSLSLAVQFESAEELCELLLHWVDEHLLFTPRVKQVFALFKPRLTAFRPSEIHHVRWRLLPLYRDMIANPDDYWLEEIKEKALAWAKGRHEASLRKLEDGRLLRSCPRELITLAADPNWRDLAMPILHQKLGETDWNKLKIDVSVETMAIVIEYWQQCEPPQKEAMRPLWTKAFTKANAALILSANTRLLDQFIQVMSPQEMLALCKHPLLGNRLEVMLHLHPKVVSQYEGVVINKNSLRFRDWVLFKLPCTGHRVADLKLLHYYFCNRAEGAYPGHTIFNCEEAGYDRV